MDRVNTTKKAIQSYKSVAYTDFKPENHSLCIIQKTTMPIIHCVCGNAILVLPDLKEMDKAIETHLAAHKKIDKTPKSEGSSIDNLKQHLIEQLLTVASKF
ncbi:MAG: hypothetical protein ACXV2C_08665 [Candidatus Bathyarchaeia archaeon]